MADPDVPTIPYAAARVGRLVRHRGDQMMGKIGSTSGQNDVLTYVRILWADGIVNSWYGEQLGRLEFLGHDDVPDTHFGDLHDARF